MRKKKEPISVTDEEMEELRKDPQYDLLGEREKKEEALKEAYDLIMDILKEYCDIDKQYYSLIAVWIIGTYCHKQFNTYPYLFFNAMRGSGKTRTLKIIKDLSKNGEMLNSLTEAVLFRTKGTLCIDEFEGLNRKGNENLRELLNSAYKKGTKVKRMKQQKTIDGVQQVVEEFEVYRPIAIANIWGMENVLGDRCINIILEKSNNPKITKLMEIWKDEPVTTQIVKSLNLVFSEPEKAKSENASVVSVDDVAVREVYKTWNYIVRNYTNYTNYTNNTNNINNTNYTNYTKKDFISTKRNYFFEKLLELEIDGRHLELAMPLFILANKINKKVFIDLTETIRDIVKEKKESDQIENMDVSLYDFFSQQLEDDKFILLKTLTQRFKEFLQADEDWINSKWMTRALDRLKLVKKKRRKHFGVEIIPNYQKAQEKIRMFK